MKGSELFQQLESDARLLKKMSQEYQPASAEFEALRRAAMALAYVVMNQRADFRAFVETMNGDLSKKQRTELSERYGID